MAATDEGRALTLDHKAFQARVGAEAVARTVESWQLLNLADLDASMATWLPVYVGMLQAEHATSQRLAERYLDRYRSVEGVTDGRIVPATFDQAQAVISARVAGPLAIKSLIRGGMAPELAYTRARDAAAGRASKWAMAGGRQMLISSARATPFRVWRRVSDGHPCAFCALLVARGVQLPNSQPPDFRAHAHCGCTAEECYSDDPLRDDEFEFVDAYEQAAKQARDAGETAVVPHGRSRRDTVLWRMRRNRPDLFSDGVAA